MERASLPPPFLGSAIKKMAKATTGVEVAKQAVLASSSDSGCFLEGRSEVCGPQLEVGGHNLEKIAEAWVRTGFQATNLGKAVEELKRMISWRLSDVPVELETDDMYRDLELRKRTKCKIYLSFTSNMISSGVREVILFLVKNKMVDVLVTTAGGIEEDFIKCLKPTFVGDFSEFQGADLRKKGVNRIGNLLIPNDNYCAFEDCFRPILEKMTDEQDSWTLEDLKEDPWTPSKIIKRLGLEMNDENSLYYWAAKNDIPVFCPALTDGSIGDMLFFHSYKRNFILDIVKDVRAINDTALKAKATGMIILGGGLVKHHTCNANLMRNGADFAVFINTGQEFDGSDSGARPDEAISWGKIKINAHPVKVYADATIAFPLLVAETFAKMES